MTKCKKYYGEKEFNYDYPEGLSELILKGFVHIITTQETVGNLNFVFDDSEIDLGKWKLLRSYNYLNVEEDDNVLIVPHGVFTRMCYAWGQGDIANDEDISMRELILSIYAKKNIEQTVTLDSVVSDRIAQRAADEEKLFDSSPRLPLRNGINKVNVYYKAKQQFTFLFEEREEIDLDKVTLIPIRK
ncbi:MAG: hypothetical protein EOO49_08820 [Flavobacterium sp.]|nr:MAG: hypothetical protein EOO49_08820 [Flavobacterium sp.]